MHVTVCLTNKGAHILKGLPYLQGLKNALCTEMSAKTFASLQQNELQVA